MGQEVQHTQSAGLLPLLKLLPPEFCTPAETKDEKVLGPKYPSVSGLCAKSHVKNNNASPVIAVYLVSHEKGGGKPLQTLRPAAAEQAATLRCKRSQPYAGEDSHHGIALHPEPLHLRESHVSATSCSSCLPSYSGMALLPRRAWACSLHTQLPPSTPAERQVQEANMPS